MSITLTEAVKQMVPWHKTTLDWIQQYNQVIMMTVPMTVIVIARYYSVPSRLKLGNILILVNVQARDVCLLHRYNEPVLLVLHESDPTWAGKLVDKKDTMCLTAFSLNLHQQKHLRLWHTEDLPSDAHKLIPVPLGGAIVLCQSLMLYHSQVISRL